MKRILTIITLLLVCNIMHAQFYLGGSLGFHTDYKDAYSAAIMPEIGYCINEYNSVSLAVGYSYDNIEYDGVHSIYVAPCYTRTIPIDDYWCFDINGTLGFEKPINTSGFSTGIYIGPQLEYALTTRWTIWSAFDLLSIDMSFDNIDNKVQYQSGSLSFDFFNKGITFGFYYYF